MNPKLLLGLLLMAAVALFAVQNAAAVELRFLAWSLALSQALLLFAALLAGFLGGWTLRAWSGWRRSRRREPPAGP